MLFLFAQLGSCLLGLALLRALRRLCSVDKSRDSTCLRPELGTAFSESSKSCILRGPDGKLEGTIPYQSRMTRA